MHWLVLHARVVRLTAQCTYCRRRRMSTVPSRLSERRHTLSQQERASFGHKQPHGSLQLTDRLIKYIYAQQNQRTVATPYFAFLPAAAEHSKCVQLAQQLVQYDRACKVDIDRLFCDSNSVAPLAELFAGTQTASHAHTYRLPVSCVPQPVSTRKLIVDVGSGFAECVTDLALSNAQHHYIGIERLTKRAMRGLTRYHMLRHTADCNFYMFNADAALVVQYLMPHNSIDVVYCNYLDTYIKRQHAKHRLINAQFVELLARTVKLGAGVVNIVHDHVDTISSVNELFLQSPYFDSAYGNTYITANQLDSAQRVTTAYGAIWSARGHDAYYLQFKRNTVPFM